MIAWTSTSMGTSRACSQIKDEAGNPAVTRISGPVPAASCSPSSLQPLCVLAPCTCQASCQGYLPNGSSSCSACCSPCLPAGWGGPHCFRQLGRGFMGMQGLGALCTGGRASQRVLCKVPREPMALQQDPGHWLGSHSGKRDVMGEFLVPRACKSAQPSEMRRGSLLQRHCREVS